MGHRCLSVVLFAVVLFATSNQSCANDRPPNVVLIFTDDLGYGDVGAYGATKVKTPNIDRLAEGGRMFLDAHSASAVCTPSRYALLTGQYPFRGKLGTGPVMSRGGLVIDPDRTTLADMMKRAGYSTAIIGKWHLGFGDNTPDWNGDLKPGPLELGFDYYFGLPVVNSHPPFVLVENHRVLGLDPDDPLVYGGQTKTKKYREKMIQSGGNTISGGEAAHALYDDEKLGEQFTAKAIDWMKQHPDQPFFLIFATPHIHHPFTFAPRFKGTSEASIYGDFIHELDWMVGQIMNSLDEMGVADNTIIVFTSDNGGMINIGGQEAVAAGHRLNGDLLGFKFDAWEGGHRVPYIVRWPGKVPANTKSTQMICHVDLFSTLAAIVDEPLGDDDAVDSFNMLETWAGEPEKPLRDHMVVMPRSAAHVMMRSGDWVYIGKRGGGGFGNPNVGKHLFGGPAAVDYVGHEHSDMIGGKFKPDAPNRQLYNLKDDPQQSSNVINDHPETAERLAKQLKKIREGQGTRPIHVQRQRKDN